MTEYRCLCGHFQEEHTTEGGCAGCDAGGRDLATIEHAYRPDWNWPVLSSEMPILVMEQRANERLRLREDVERRERGWMR